MQPSWNRKFALLLSAIGICSVAFVVGRSAESADPLSLERAFNAVFGVPDETDARAPVDYGPGPGKGRQVEAAKAEVADTVMSSSPAVVPTGGTNANVTGFFGAPVTWPIIPIHVILLPDGRVLSYGSTEAGLQGAELYYDVWNPALGTGTSAHTVLPNSTGTDIFCSAQSVMLSGQVLISGGDLTVNGHRNSANNKTNIFSPSANTLTSNTAMTYARWYGSLVALPNGQLVIIGGRQNVGTLTPAQPASTPELYNPSTQTWKSLSGATNSGAFASNWFYPRAFLAPGGNVFEVGINGDLFSLSTSGAGSFSRYLVNTTPGMVSFPTIPYAPGKVLSVRNSQVVTIDYTQATPVVAQTAAIDQVRHWASGTVMADGKVLVTGGSQVINKLTGVAYQAQIWNPATGTWTAGASAVKPRLYHSNSMLLSDGTVFTGGGGAPGPVANLNAEIYYPPYLYTAGGVPAVRPSIESASPTSLNPGDALNLVVGATDEISRISFIRTGSATHSYNTDQRFLSLSFSQSGQNVTATLPTDSTVMVPGYYMVFAFNAAGVPSVATIVAVQ